MLNWFPGHMNKAKKLIQQNLKWVDVVLELLDARVPFSSRNPLLQEILQNKPTLLVFTKADLAESQETKKWLHYYRQQKQRVIAINALQNRKQKELALLARQGAKEELFRRQKKGIKNRVVRLMVVGIPNVGKSTLINNLKGRSVASTGNKPGVTRGKQWIRLDNDLELLDMPGILWPKITSESVGCKLAVTGAVKAEVYDARELAFWLIEWLKQNKPGRLTERYQLREEATPQQILAELCQKRGALLPGGAFDLEKGAQLLLREFQLGRLGRVTLDVC